MLAKLRPSQPKQPHRRLCPFRHHEADAGGTAQSDGCAGKNMCSTGGTYGGSNCGPPHPGRNCRRSWQAPSLADLKMQPNQPLPSPPASSQRVRFLSCHALLLEPVWRRAFQALLCSFVCSCSRSNISSLDFSMASSASVFWRCISSRSVSSCCMCTVCKRFISSNSALSVEASEPWMILCHSAV